MTLHFCQSLPEKNDLISWRSVDTADLHDQFMTLICEAHFDSEALKIRT